MIWLWPEMHESMGTKVKSDQTVYYGFLTEISCKLCLLEHSSACSDDKSYLGVGLIVCICLNLWLIYSRVLIILFCPITRTSSTGSRRFQFVRISCPHPFHLPETALCIPHCNITHQTSNLVCQSLSGVCTVLCVYVLAVWAVFCWIIC